MSLVQKQRWFVVVFGRIQRGAVARMTQLPCAASSRGIKKLTLCRTTLRQCPSTAQLAHHFFSRKGNFHPLSEFVHDSWRCGGAHCGVDFSCDEGYCLPFFYSFSANRFIVAQKQSIFRRKRKMCTSPPVRRALGDGR